MLSTIENFQKILDYTFNDSSLLREAFTHPSYSSEKKLPRNNQRLEFLGDAVIQLIATEYLFAKYPFKSEGELTIYRASLVKQSSLADFARYLRIQDYLLLGKGEREQNGYDRDSNLCDAFEAIIGAIYLDSNLSEAKRIFQVIAREYIESLDLSPEERNPKGALQEYLQKAGTSKPEYTLRNVIGKEHEPLFTVDLFINGSMISSGEGRSVKQAEVKAASLALKKLRTKQ